LREVLLNDGFWSGDNPGVLVKWPVEFVVGTVLVRDHL
jgi:hypothetical protein